MLKIGCAEQELEVPLFAELYGYGPFAGRRNCGINDPLYCRVAIFDENQQRVVIIYSDICSTDDEIARKMREKIAGEFSINPACIAFVATHTHTAPPVSTGKNGIGFGEPDPKFQLIWSSAVMQSVKAALTNLEPIDCIEAGRAPLKQKLGRNRINPKDNLTDPSIRWVRFMRKDGSPKLILHNHGIHGVAMNGPVYSKLVSADWMGAANRIIKERSIADYSIFLQGPAGDINTYTSVLKSGSGAADTIGHKYVDDLECDLKNNVQKIECGKISGILQTVEFPTIVQSSKEVREDIAKITKATRQMDKSVQDWAANLSARLYEMALLLERGDDLRVSHDLQIIKIGKITICFIPGEFFIKPGLQLLDEINAPFPFVATLANGNGAYYFSQENAEKYPDISCFNKNCFGFYEIYGYMHSHRFKYQNNIAQFIITKLKEMEYNAEVGN